MPALLISTSRQLYWLVTSAAAFAMLSALATSNTRGSTRPTLLSASDAARALWQSRAVSSTTKPVAASCRQTSNPIPRLAPVTNATRTRVCCILLLLLLLAIPNHSAIRQSEQVNLLVVHKFRCAPRPSALAEHANLLAKRARSSGAKWRPYLIETMGLQKRLGSTTWWLYPSGRLTR